MLRAENWIYWNWLQERNRRTKNILRKILENTLKSVANEAVKGLPCSNIWFPYQKSTLCLLIPSLKRCPYPHHWKMLYNYYCSNLHDQIVTPIHHVSNFKLRNCDLHVARVNQELRWIWPETRDPILSPDSQWFLGGGGREREKRISWTDIGSHLQSPSTSENRKNNTVGLRKF